MIRINGISAAAPAIEKAAAPAAKHEQHKKHEHKHKAEEKKAEEAAPAAK
jgi:hypothetical protein